MRSHPPASRCEAVLAVSLSAPDREFLAALSDTVSWRLTCAEKPAQALRKARCRGVRVVLCERDLPEGDWRLLFNGVRDLLHAPRFIVVSRHADESLWAEVLNLGGYDVLALPFSSEEVRRIVGCAIEDGRGRLPSGLGSFTMSLRGPA